MSRWASGGESCSKRKRKHTEKPLRISDDDDAIHLFLAYGVGWCNWGSAVLVSGDWKGGHGAVEAPYILVFFSCLSFFGVECSFQKTVLAKSFADLASH